MSILNETIRSILDSHSGGIKFIDLVFEIQDFISNEEIDEKSISDIDNLPDIVENLVREDPYLKILEYTWHRCNKSKMFVYTP
jgi:hypothetical protein